MYIHNCLYAVYIHMYVDKICIHCIACTAYEYTCTCATHILSLYPVDSADNCRVVTNAAQIDTDDDGIGDACDNCVFNNNTFQENVDGDIAGAVCDANDTDPGVGGFNLFS